MTDDMIFDANTEAGSLFDLWWLTTLRLVVVPLSLIMRLLDDCTIAPLTNPVKPLPRFPLVVRVLSGDFIPLEASYRACSTFSVRPANRDPVGSACRPSPLLFTIFLALWNWELLWGLCNFTMLFPLCDVIGVIVAVLCVACGWKCVSMNWLCGVVAALALIGWLFYRLLSMWLPWSIGWGA